MSLPEEAITLDDFELKDLNHPMSVANAEEKLQVAMHYYIYGSPKKAADQMANPRITAKTVSSWKQNAQWWPMLIEKCRKIKNEELEQMLTNTLHDSMGELRDRINNGDLKLDKDGQLTTVPVPARDLAYITQTVFDKRALARGEGGVKKSKSTEEQLIKIAETLTETIRAANTSAASPGIRVIEQIEDEDITDVPL